MSKKIVRLTNEEFMKKNNVERKHLPFYIETYSYKSLMLSVAVREAIQQVKNAFVITFKHRKK